MVRIYTEVETIFEGKIEDYELMIIREKFKNAYSYTIPIWRLILFSKSSNYLHWLKQVEKRLNK